MPYLFGGFKPTTSKTPFPILSNVNPGIRTSGPNVASITGREIESNSPSSFSSKESRLLGQPGESS
ncbi:hypothetical protein PGT21_014376 [Puccinia graminis f. sp. tritici]|uniref:Uncharacterized protein n=1 Tax=Puccinia graminis f. sp. tritici TaxID=56615 RepID=A0A5B0QI36_PUCGR|nr:hypothetical protein PGT21_014376 [Puccinia graminis f. sp. tritici]